MTVAEKLFVACLRANDNDTLAKVQQNWIDVKEFKQYRYITDYLRDYGENPPVSDFASKFKLDPAAAPSKPGHYYTELQDRFILTELAENVPGIMSSAKKDVRKALKELRTVLGNLDVTEHTTRDVRYDTETEKRFQEYQEKKINKGVTHLSSGNEFLDKYWYGYRKADLITFAGRAGLGKTWLLILLTLLLEKILTEDQGDILFISNEMPEDEIKERFDSVRFKLPYGNFLHGELNRAQEAKYKVGLERLGKRGSKIVFAYNCDTLEELKSKIALYKPSMVFIDGSYLMEPQMKEGWEKIVTITRALKKMAKDTETPIMNTTQLKRGAGKAQVSQLEGQDEFAYGGSFIQDSDIGVRMFQDKDMVYEGCIGLDHVKGRRLRPDLKLRFKLNLETMELTIYEEEELPVPATTIVDY